MAIAIVSGLTLIADLEGAPSIVNIGGGPGAATTGDVVIEGSQAIGRRINTTGAIRGFGTNFTAVDFTVAGRYLWVWWNAALGPSNARTIQEGGIRIRVSSNTAGTGNYKEWFVGGSDVTQQGRWNRTLIDVNGAGFSLENGSLNEAAVVFVGVTYIYDAAPGGNVPHVVMDALHYGSVTTVTGGTPGDPLTWRDVAEATEQNAWGVMRAVGGGFFCNGTIRLGSAPGSPNEDCILVDQGQILEWEAQYFVEDGSPGAVYSLIPDGAQGLQVRAGQGVKVQLTDGQKVGAGDDVQGILGSLFQKQALINPGGTGPLIDNPNRMAFDLGDADITAVELNGTTVKRADHSCVVGPDAAGIVECNGTQIFESTQVEAKRAKMRGGIIGSTVNVDGALLWNADIDIKNWQFIGNTSDPASPRETCAIEHEFAEASPTTVATYDGLSFTGNDFDICLTTEGELVVQAQNDANPGTFRVTASPSSVEIQNAVGLTVTCKNSQGVNLEGIRVRIEEAPGGALVAEGETNAGGVFSASFNYTADQDVIVRARRKGFVPNSASATVESTGLSVPFTMILDTSVNLP